MGYNDGFQNRYKYPCGECTQKYLGCHDKCENYLEIKKKNQKIKEIMELEYKTRPLKRWQTQEVKQ